MTLTKILQLKALIAQRHCHEWLVAPANVGSSFLGNHVVDIMLVRKVRVAFTDKNGGISRLPRYEYDG